MKNILIVSIESNAKAYTPAGKEMRLLARKLADKNRVTLFTTYSKTEEFAEKIIDKNLKFEYIKSPRYFFYRFFEKQKKVRTFLGELFLKIYYKFFKKKINQINYKPFYKWLKNQKERYDIVISVSNPLMNHDFARQIQEKGIAQDWYLFFLDPFSDAYSLSLEEQNRRRQKEIGFFEQCEQIFTTQPIFNHSEELHIEKYQSKTIIIPDIFICDKTEFHKEGFPKEIHAGYLGSFIPKIREPQKFFKILSFLPKSIFVDIYYGGCETVVSRLDHGENVRVHDLIKDAEQYNITVGEMDILINIGNFSTNQIASKIYDYIGFGKPIIHFYQNEEDLTIQKFGKYSNIRFIDYRLDPELAAKEFFKACLELKGKTVSYQTVQELFGADTLDCFTEKYFN